MVGRYVRPKVPQKTWRRPNENLRHTYASHINWSRWRATNHDSPERHCQKRLWIVQTFQLWRHGDIIWRERFWASPIKAHARQGVTSSLHVLPHLKGKSATRSVCCWGGRVALVDLDRPRLLLPDRWPRGYTFWPETGLILGRIGANAILKNHN